MRRRGSNPSAALRRSWGAVARRLVTAKEPSYRPVPYDWPVPMLRSVPTLYVMTDDDGPWPVLLRFLAEVEEDQVVPAVQLLRRRQDTREL